MTLSKCCLSLSLTAVVVVIMATSGFDFVLFGAAGILCDSMTCHWNRVHSYGAREGVVLPDILQNQYKSRSRCYHCLASIAVLIVSILV